MTYRELRRLIGALYHAIIDLDWSLMLIVSAFLSVVWWMQRGFVISAVEPALGPKRDAAHIAYEAAIADAAVKRPAYAVKLKTIPTSATAVNVVSFGQPGPVDAKTRAFEIWVALPDELRDACKGAANPARRLQEVLGLPPVDVPNHIVREIQVSRDGLFRPCVAGGDLSEPYCSLELPQPDPSAASAPAASSAPTAPTARAGAPSTNQTSVAPAAAGNGGASAVAPCGVAAAGGNSSWDELSFAARQMWNTYRRGFLSSKVKSGDYPYTGYPFTGMGWSYDWSDVPNHIGVSEFVIKRNAPITLISSRTPAEFCAAQ